MGAERFGFGTSALVSLGCILMRKCHLGTCPVGIATQDPDLRKRFHGKAEYVVRFLTFVAEDIRRVMAELGFRKFDDMVGHVERLSTNKAIDHWKAKGLDFSAVFAKPDQSNGCPLRRIRPQSDTHKDHLDWTIIEQLGDALEQGKRTRLEMPIRNIHRTVGAILSNRIVKLHGGKGLPDGTFDLTFTGSAGQSFGAFLAKGVTMKLIGDANDYLGKGLSGGRIIVQTPPGSPFDPKENVIVGNTLLYGATGGEVYINGLTGERFAVRNSGAVAVVEGVGDHGCEYMTSGIVVVLGRTGRNFAAGMSGGIAYVLDENQMFDTLCNLDMVDLEPVHLDEDLDTLQDLIRRHLRWTGSLQAKMILDRWRAMSGRFVKVMPIDYRKALARLRERETVKSEGRPHRGVFRMIWRDATDPSDRKAAQYMANPTGFKQFTRCELPHRPVSERIKDWYEIDQLLVDKVLNEQAARCMDCGIPFCHASGCPVKNRIPEFNDLVYRGQWRAAADNLHSTNNFPELTGRVCPAPCEAACTLAINDRAVNIKHIELQIAEKAFKEGWVEPVLPPTRYGQARGGDRLRPGRPGRGPADQSRRPRDGGLREGRPHRRPVALRHSRFQAGEAHHRPPPRADVA